MFEVAVSIVLLVLVLAVVGSLAYGALSAAPWVPLRLDDIDRLLALVEPKPGEVLFDLGCGDGRILTAAHKLGLKSYGFEIALVPYLLARLRLLLSGAEGQGQVQFKNFWRLDLAPADIVVCFLTPAAMRRLLPKLKAELKTGARFATYAFPLPQIKPTAISKPLPTDASIYLYKNIVQPVGKVVDS